jgi:thermostable 8-oxoguanine DNA glycosylase
MKKEELERLKLEYITQTNQEWVEILNLRKKVKEDISKYGCIKIDTFENILKWKLRKQKGRTEKHRKYNTDDIINILTSSAIRIEHPNSNIMDQIRASVLMSIPGVGIGVASAILALTYPESYGVIDYINWKVLYEENKRSFSMNEYLHYLNDLRKIAKDFNTNVQDVDYLLWKKGMLTTAST